MTAPHHDSGRPRRSTIEDVASAAGVSVATVSRALRGLPNVAVSTRQRVTEVAEHLHYTPDPAASRLAVGRTQTITVVVQTLNSWYTSSVVAGAEAVSSDAGYDVLVVCVGSHNDLSRLLGESYHLERRTDGLILVDIPIDAEQIASISGRGVAITTIGYPTPGHPSIRIDNAEVGRLAAQHLAERGHERVGIITSADDETFEFAVSRLRHEGFAAELSRRGISIADDLIEVGGLDLQGGQEAMAGLLDRANPPTGIFSMSDEMAFGALMELGQRGLTPGVDIGIVGVDNHEFSQVVGLTTIHQSVTEHGAAASRLLLTSMEQSRTAATTDGPSDVHPEVIAPVELIVRTTT